MNNQKELNSRDLELIIIALDNNRSILNVMIIEMNRYDKLNDKQIMILNRRINKLKELDSLIERLKA